MGRKKTAMMIGIPTAAMLATGIGIESSLSPYVGAAPIVAVDKAPSHTEKISSHTEAPMPKPTLSPADLDQAIQTLAALAFAEFSETPAADRRSSLASDGTALAEFSATENGNPVKFMISVQGKPGQKTYDGFSVVETTELGETTATATLKNGEWMGTAVDPSIGLNENLTGTEQMLVFTDGNPEPPDTKLEDVMFGWQALKQNAQTLLEAANNSGVLQK